MNVIELEAELQGEDLLFNADFKSNDLSFNGELSTEISLYEGESGTRYYDRLLGKPQINGYELKSGDNSLTDIGVTQLIDNRIGNVEVLLETI